MKQGIVTLVGAGPGDPELLTVKAVKAIRGASLLLVDDLVADDVIGLASSTARIVHVGKRGGCRSTPQEFILRMMVQASQAGENVVRLKGGDPFIFGRGGEEQEHLSRHGIEVQVVNGITAGLAAASLVGVPLTHRELAQGVVFVTGHTRADGTSVDWPQLAEMAQRAHLTLVIYMGVRNADSLQQALLKGMPGSTPFVAVQDASLPGQKMAAGTLDQLARIMQSQRIASPAVIVLGEVSRATLLAHTAMAQARNAAA
jgi:uroporphyrin-III C-methyltransferase